MLIWQAKSEKDGTYINMPTPSSYGIDWEDLDSKSYRSINTGDLLDSVISKSWSKLKLSYNYLTFDKITTILSMLSNNPIYVKAKNPIFGNEYTELEMRCSKKSAELLQTGDYTLSFNLVQKKKVDGQ